MNDIISTRTVSLQSSNINWEIVDKRAEEIGLDRSKYTQMLYDLELKHHILSNHKILSYLKNNKRYDLRVIDIVFLLFLLAIFTLLIAASQVI